MIEMMYDTYGKILSSMNDEKCVHIAKNTVVHTFGETMPRQK
jgi:hypothetical protein